MMENDWQKRLRRARKEAKRLERMGYVKTGYLTERDYDMLAYAPCYPIVMGPSCSVYDPEFLVVYDSPRSSTNRVAQ